MRHVDIAPGRYDPVTPDDRCTAMTVVGRQAIYDVRGEIVAHELLFRTVGATEAAVVDADRATLEVIVSAFTDIGMDELVGDSLAFVNIPRQFLLEGFCSMLPPERVVLEILEDVLVDEFVIRAARELAAAGYQIALDDFEYRPDLQPLLDLASIIKVDLLALSGDDLDRTLDRIRPHGCRLLAEKIEDRDDMPTLVAKGFELFQGYGLDRPQLVHSARASSNRMVMFQVLSELYRPDLEIAGVVDVISHDPSLAYALLKTVNSAAMRRSTRISTLQHAVVMLGVDALRTWATVLLMTRVADRSAASLTGSLVRAKLAELAAPEAGVAPEVGFTVGLLSSLPDLMGQPLPELLERLSLDPAVEDALLDGTGPLGLLLAWVLAYEAADDDRLLALDAPASLAGAYLESVAWARQVSSSMAGDQIG